MTTKTSLAKAVVDAVMMVTGGPEPHHPPSIERDDVVAVMAQLRDLGSYDRIGEFERQLAATCEVSHAVATSSGTVALEIALATAGVGPGDKVAVPALSFVATANAVRHRGADPVFVDVEADSMGISPRALQEVLDLHDGGIRVVIAVHMLGHPCRIHELMEVCAGSGVALIEDAAEALGSRCESRPCGWFGVMSVLSFNVNKIVTAGGGGAVLTDNGWLHERARHLATTARVRDPAWEVAHDDVAWNGRISMLAGALGAAQVGRLSLLVQAKRALAAAYRDAFSRVDGVQFHLEPKGTTSNYWLPSITVPAEDRVAVLTALNEAGLGARALFKPLDQIPPYRQPVPCPTADACYRTEVCLPAGLELAKRFL